MPFCLLALAAALATHHVAGEVITGVTAHGWPNERTAAEMPALAVDGDLGTFTWTTAAFNLQAGYLGLDFRRNTTVDRIRFFKDNNGGGGPNIKNLDILVTADSSATALKDRNFVHVSNLVNGYQGTELLQATSVNGDGTVLGDVHDEGDGWASLSFDPILATGVAIRFFYPGGSFQHYRAYEFQAYSTPSPVPEIDPAGMGSVLALVTGTLGLIERRRSKAG